MQLWWTHARGLDGGSPCEGVLASFNQDAEGQRGRVAGSRMTLEFEVAWQSRAHGSRAESRDRFMRCSR